MMQEYFQTWSTTLMMADDLDGQYAIYFKETEVMEKSLGGMFIDLLILCLNCYVLFGLLQHDRTEAGKVICGIFLIALLFDLFFSGLYGNLGRFRYLIDIINIIAYAYYMRYKPNIIVKLLVLIVFGYAYYKNMSYGSYETVPYELNFWLIK